jgi:ferritin-like metal-binding protein YciE
MPNTPINSKLEEFFLTLLQEMYWAETNLVNVLATMVDASSTPQLQHAFDTHRQQTMVHIQRVEHAFDLLDKPRQAEPSAGLQGLFDEGWQVIDETPEGSAQRDVALIIAAQKVEHYEIATYGSMVTLAQTLERGDIASLLQLTLTEEKETDSLLTDIAEKGINFDASREPVTSEPAIP